MHRWLVLMLCACTTGTAEIGNTNTLPTGTTTGNTSVTGTTTGTPTGTTGTQGQVVTRTFDLTGSRLFIDADFTEFLITLEEPYEDDDTMGPGTLVMTLTADASGNPIDGPVTLTYIELIQMFTTGVDGFAEVTTDLENLGDLQGAPIATGTLSGSIATWDGPLDPYCQTGEVSCSGFFCGTSGAPEEGNPFVFDNDCSTLPLSDFAFEPDFTSFDSEPVLLSKDANQATALSLSGTYVP